MNTNKYYDSLLNEIFGELNISKVRHIDTKQKRLLLKNYLIKSNIKFDKEYISKINKLLQYELSKQYITNIDIYRFDLKTKIFVWKGDITLLKCDAIVNAGNDKMLGCFNSDHTCIDNIIHQKAGPELREECNTIMKGSTAKISKCIVTKGYNLPSKFIIHTNGPIVEGELTKQNISDLRECYVNCLNTAKLNKFNHIAFCNISTGLFGFPKKEASCLVRDTINEWFVKNKYSSLVVIFVCYDPENFTLYKKLFGC